MSRSTPIWKPAEVLNLYLDDYGFTCVGITRQGRRCRNRLSHLDLSTAGAILNEIALLNPYSNALQSRLERLASVTLCSQWHRNPGYSQINSMTCKWQASIENSQNISLATVPVIQQPSVPQSSHTNHSASSTTTSNNRADIIKITSAVFSIFDRTILRSTEEELDYKTLLQDIGSAKTALDLLANELHRRSHRESASSNQSSPERGVSTHDNDPAPLSPEIPSQSARSVSSPTWVSASSSSASTTSSSLPDTASRQQRSEPVTPATPTTLITSITPTSITSLAVNSARSAPSASLPLADTASATLEARAAVPIPGPATSIRPTPSSSTTTIRKSLAEPCCVCTEKIDHLDDAVWCRAQCGQNFHSECFSVWEETQKAKNRTVNCIFCRAQWRYEQTSDASD